MGSFLHGLGHTSLTGSRHSCPRERGCVTCFLLLSPVQLPGFLLLSEGPQGFPPAPSRHQFRQTLSARLGQERSLSLETKSPNGPSRAPQGDVRVSPSPNMSEMRMHAALPTAWF